MKAANVLRGSVSIAGIAIGAIVLHELASYLISLQPVMLDFWMAGVREALLKSSSIAIAFVLHRNFRPKVDLYVWLTWTLILQHFGSLAYYVVNVPVIDDFIVLIPFALEPSFSTLIEPFNGSKLVVNKALVWVMTLAHSVDFRILIFLANIAITALVFLLAKQPKSRFLVALLLLNFAYYDVNTWASSVCNALVVLFSVLAFRSAHLQRTVTAMLYATLATLTFGNGIFALLLVLPLLKKWVVPAVYSAVFIVLFALGGASEVHLISPVEYMAYLSVFLGVFFQFGYTIVLPMAGGILMLFVIGHLGSNSYYKKDPVNASIILFILLSGMALSYFRSWLDLETALANRYILYSLVLLIALGKAVLKPSRSLLIAAGCYAASVSFLFTGEVTTRKERLIDYRDRLLSGRPTIHYKPIIPAEADSLSLLAIEKGIWRP